MKSFFQRIHGQSGAPKSTPKRTHEPYDSRTTKERSQLNSTTSARPPGQYTDYKLSHVRDNARRNDDAKPSGFKYATMPVMGKRSHSSGPQPPSQTVTNPFYSRSQSHSKKHDAYDDRRQRDIHIFVSSSQSSLEKVQYHSDSPNSQRHGRSRSDNPPVVVYPAGTSAIQLPIAQQLSSRNGDRKRHVSEQIYVVRERKLDSAGFSSKVDNSSGLEGQKDYARQTRRKAEEYPVKTGQDGLPQDLSWNKSVLHPTEPARDYNSRQHDRNHRVYDEKRSHQREVPRTFDADRPVGYERDKAARVESRQRAAETGRDWAYHTDWEREKYARLDKGVDPYSGKNGEWAREREARSREKEKARHHHRELDSKAEREARGRKERDGERDGKRDRQGEDELYKDRRKERDRDREWAKDRDSVKDREREKEREKRVVREREMQTTREKERDRQRGSARDKARSNDNAQGKYQDAALYSLRMPEMQDMDARNKVPKDKKNDAVPPRDGLRGVMRSDGVLQQRDDQIPDIVHDPPRSKSHSKKASHRAEADVKAFGDVRLNLPHHASPEPGVSSQSYAPLNQTVSRSRHGSGSASREVLPPYAIQQPSVRAITDPPSAVSTDYLPGPVDLKSNATNNGSSRSRRETRANQIPQMSSRKLEVKAKDAPVRGDTAQHQSSVIYSSSAKLSSHGQHNASHAAASTPFREAGSGNTVATGISPGQSSKGNRVQEAAKVLPAGVNATSSENRSYSPLLKGPFDSGNVQTTAAVAPALQNYVSTSSVTYDQSVQHTKNSSIHATQGRNMTPVPHEGIIVGPALLGTPPSRPADSALRTTPENMTYEVSSAEARQGYSQPDLSIPRRPGSTTQSSQINSQGPGKHAQTAPSNNVPHVSNQSSRDSATVSPRRVPDLIAKYENRSRMNNNSGEDPTSIHPSLSGRQVQERLRDVSSKAKSGPYDNITLQPSANQESVTPSLMHTSQRFAQDRPGDIPSAYEQQASIPNNHLGFSIPEPTFRGYPAETLIAQGSHEAKSLENAPSYSGIPALDAPSHGRPEAATSGSDGRVVVAAHYSHSSQQAVSSARPSNPYASTKLYTTMSSEVFDTSRSDKRARNFSQDGYSRTESTRTGINAQNRHAIDSEINHFMDAPESKVKAQLQSPKVTGSQKPFTAQPGSVASAWQPSIPSAIQHPVLAQLLSPPSPQPGPQHGNVPGERLGAGISSIVTASIMPYSNSSQVNIQTSSSPGKPRSSPGNSSRNFTMSSSGPEGIPRSENTSSHSMNHETERPYPSTKSTILQSAGPQPSKTLASHSRHTSDRGDYRSVMESTRATSTFASNQYPHLIQGGPASGTKKSQSDEFSSRFVPTNASYRSEVPTSSYRIDPSTHSRTLALAGGHQIQIGIAGRSRSTAAGAAESYSYTQPFTIEAMSEAGQPLTSESPQPSSSSRPPYTSASLQQQDNTAESSKRIRSQPVTGQKTRISSDESLLRTPSSLAPSMLKPTASQSSIPVSTSSRTRKKGLFGFLRSISGGSSQSAEDLPPKPSAIKNGTAGIDPKAIRVKLDPPPSQTVPILQRRSSGKKSNNKAFTPFRYLSSKRNRSMSAASMEAQDGTAANTVIGSPTASMHSQAALQPPPLRDAMAATREWRDHEATLVRHLADGKIRRQRPGVVFDLEGDSFEDERPRMPRTRSHSPNPRAPHHHSTK